MKFIEFDIDGSIHRPVDEVRSQFFDVEYHARKGIHSGILYEISEHNENNIVFTQEIIHMGLRQVEVTNHKILTNGDLITSVVTGVKEGFKSHFTFKALSKNVTHINAKISYPIKGFKRFFAPFYKFALKRTALKELSEDKQDLESGSFLNYRTLRRGQLDF